MRSTVIDVETITSVVAELSSSEEDLAQESVQVPYFTVYYHTTNISC